MAFQNHIVTIGLRQHDQPRVSVRIIAQVLSARVLGKLRLARWIKAYLGLDDPRQAAGITHLNIGISQAVMVPLEDHRGGIQVRSFDFKRGGDRGQQRRSVTQAPAQCEGEAVLVAADQLENTFDRLVAKEEAWHAGKVPQGTKNRKADFERSLRAALS